MSHGPRCPNCGQQAGSVVDSRLVNKKRRVRRRRLCGNCGWRWNTWEADANPELSMPRPWQRLTDEQRAMITTLIFALDRQNQQPAQTEKRRQRRALEKELA